MSLEHHEVLAKDCYSAPRQGSKRCVRRPYSLRAPERGTFAVMFAGILVLMLAICGLALDMGQIYNRKVELDAMAKAAALAAARELNGTAAGITAALQRAKETAERFKYQYSRSIVWTDAAISFSASPLPGANWVAAETARTTPTKLFYVKVNTSALDSATATVNANFLPILSNSLATFNLSDRAVAGRTAINMVPLAVCAMSPDQGISRTNPGPPATVELVEYGFRRGVSYDLMQLNPNGTTAENFLIDPISAPGTPGLSSNMSISVVGPFVCTGTMWMPSVTGGTIRVSRPFPIGSLYRQLNSRFDQYEGGLCNPHGAPPDFNIKQFSYSVPNGISWMNPAPTSQSASPYSDDGKLRTIADLPTAPHGTTPRMYGPLWSYAKAVRFSSYVEGAPEPQGGYTPFTTADWHSLYKPSPSAPSYPNSFQGTPYAAISGVNYQRPSAENLPFAKPHRRVLNVALLSCPVSSGASTTASVLAVAKFFMTVPATPTSIDAEFAGVVPEESLRGQVELYE